MMNANIIQVKILFLNNQERYLRFSICTPKIRTSNEGKTILNEFIMVFYY